MSAFQQQNCTTSKQRFLRRSHMYRRRSSEMMGALYEDVEKFFGDIFAYYAKLVVRFPVPFVIVPLVVCGIFSLGMLKSHHETDVEKLYTPRDSISLENRNMVSSKFVNKTDSFYGHQQITAAKYGEIIVTCKAGANICKDNILAEKVLHEVFILYKDVVYNVTIGASKELSFNDCCTLRDFKCIVDGGVIIEYLQSTASCNRNFTDLNDMFKADPFQKPDRVLSNLHETEDGCLSAVALNLRFNVRTNISENLSRQWELEFLTKMAEFQSDVIAISYGASQSLNMNINNDAERDTYLFLFSILLTLTYATILGAGSNWVSNHVTLAYVGVAAALMSMLASCGFLSLCGVPFASMTGLVPFLILGIGADDMFYLMTEWRLTSIRDSIESRLTVTMRNAAVSITITSLADILAFCIGATSPFASVKYFCALSGAAIFFCYFNQMTFFSGVLVLHAKRIQQSRHCITCFPVKSREVMEENGSRVCCLLMCSGHPPIKLSDEGGICRPFSRTFYSIYPRLLLHWLTKCCVITLFVIYICLSIWGVNQAKKGFRFEEIVPKDSQYSNFLKQKSQYFPESGPVVMFAINDPIEYYKSNTQAKLAKTLEDANKIPHVTPLSTISWFQDFDTHIKEINKNPIRSEIELISLLNEEFLPHYPQYYNDIDFNQDNSSIMASRFYVFSLNLNESQKEADLLRESKKVANNSSIPMIAYSMDFIFYEQYISIVKDTLLVIGVTMIGLLFVALVFIPHPIAISCVTVSMLSVALGMVTFMTLWGLELSAMTTVPIILSVAFCTDSTVHISHAFMTATGKNRNERVTVAIEKAGTPILNSTVSTLLVIVILALADSYIFMCFCKSMLIVVMLVFLHSLVFLPVLLSFIGPRRTSKPRVFIPVSNSARSLQDTYRCNSLTRPTNKDIEEFRAERLAKIKGIADSNDSPKITRSQSAKDVLQTPVDNVSIAQITPNQRRVSFAVGDNAFLKLDSSLVRKATSHEDMSALFEQSEEDPDSSSGDMDPQQSNAVFTIGPSHDNTI